MVQRCLIVSDCVVGAWGLSGLGSIIVQMLGRQPYFSSLKVYLYLVPWIPEGYQQIVDPGRACDASEVLDLRAVRATSIATASGYSLGRQ
ncbi:hypothetical protein A8E97_01745 [Burkholderia cenocepacia]|nr:hypothetical protein A8E88_28930 [Burkholderia cenocepacia]ONV78424.1 hypothetical protein A8E89_36055 [Burkholderia cenocepacia]ONW11205.1 hypothetical protein A8E90_24815 [Burkholderia cenocepacia]ONW16095.1 hypothetical protein A8E94_10850 [Burkholderia cenocepacia]ONW36426.1 hypothetical protein A8E99_26185 [Burkholderia cenocepacia]